uniref:hypothetical protein n=1 Tax=Pontibacter pamirensis TaxID=2562824 RepID=UPI0037440931
MLHAPVQLFYYIRVFFLLCQLHCLLDVDVGASQVVCQHGQQIPFLLQQAAHRCDGVLDIMHEHPHLVPVLGGQGGEFLHCQVLMQRRLHQAYGRDELMQNIEGNSCGDQGQQQGDTNHDGRLQHGSRPQYDKQDKADERDMDAEEGDKEELVGILVEERKPGQKLVVLHGVLCSWR